ncbi:phospholipase-like protein [Tanacetum coccineum]
METSETYTIQEVSSLTSNDIVKEDDRPSRELPCQLPPKELSPGSFALPCTIGSYNLYVMADLGTCVNIMSNSVFEYLKLTNLRKNDMLVGMANMTQQAPLGTVDNVLVKIDIFILPCDFVFIDMPGVLGEMMILGRPFLATIHAEIDVFNREISFGIDKDRVKFDVNGNYYHSNVTLEKVYMATSSQEKESFNPLEIKDDFSYESPACLRFEQNTRIYTNSNIETIDSPNNMQETIFYDDGSGEDCGIWPTCNPDLSFCSGYEAVYGKVKIGHTNIANSDWGKLFNEWVLDSFDVEGDYATKFANPYSRRFDEYRRMFNNEVEQLSNEYILRIGKKGYVLYDVWEKCEQNHRGTTFAWHDEGREEEEL